LSTSPDVELEVLPSDDTALIRAEVRKGANQTATIERLPNLGEDVVLSPYGTPERYQRPRVQEIPWTHQQITEDDLEASR
jgi:hypothetical protein